MTTAKCENYCQRITHLGKRYIGILEDETMDGIIEIAHQEIYKAVRRE